MTNKSPHFLFPPFFLLVASVLWAGCATTPPIGAGASSEDEKDSSVFSSTDERRSSAENDLSKKDSTEEDSEEPQGKNLNTKKTIDSSSSSDHLGEKTNPGSPSPSTHDEGRELVPAVNLTDGEGNDPSSDSELLPNSGEELGAVSDSGNNRGEVSSGHPEEARSFSTPVPSLFPEDDAGAVTGGQGTSQVPSEPFGEPVHVSPSVSPPNGSVPLGSESKRSGVAPLVSLPSHSARTPERVSVENASIDDFFTPSAPSSISPESANSEVEGTGLNTTLSIQVPQDVREPNSDEAKTIGLASPLLKESSPPKGLVTQVGFADKPSAPAGDSPDKVSSKVSFSDQDSTGIPSLPSTPSASVRFFGIKNGSLLTPVSEGRNTLGFSGRAPESRFLQRPTETSASGEVSVPLSSQEPYDYNSLRGFLAPREKPSPSGSDTAASTRGFEEAGVFLEAFDTSKDEGRSISHEDESASDSRYQNALQWFRSRGQGSEPQN